MLPINSASHCSYYHAQIDNPENPNQAGVAYEANCEDIIKALGLTFDEGCEFKSIWRRGRGRQGHVKAESNALRDAAKAVHYAGRVLRTEEQIAAAVKLDAKVSPGLDATHSESDGQEFVSRYDWSKAGAAQWGATDADGKSWFYHEKPEIGATSWRPKDGPVEFIARNWSGDDWANSLEARPQ